MTNDWDTILGSSKLPRNLVKLATKTLQSLIDTAVENNVPPMVFDQYTELFGATMLLIANELVEKYAKGELAVDEDTGHITVDLDSLNV